MSQGTWESKSIQVFEQSDEEHWFIPIPDPGKVSYELKTFSVVFQEDCNKTNLESYIFEHNSWRV